MLSPIERLLDRVVMTCTICGQKSGGCQCWQKCACGRSFETGTVCANPIHDTEKVALTISRNIAAQSIFDLRTEYPTEMRWASGGFRKTMAVKIERITSGAIVEWLCNNAKQDDAAIAQQQGLAVAYSVRASYPHPMDNQALFERLVAIVAAHLLGWFGEINAHEPEVKPRSARRSGQGRRGASGPAE